MHSTPLTRKTPLRAKPDQRRYRGRPKVCACGGEFMPRTMSQAYCSLTCADRYRPRGGKVERVCGGCGAPFTAYRSDVARGFGKFCSRRCADAQRTGNAENLAKGNGPAHPSFKHGRACQPTPVVNPKRFKSGQSTCQHPDCTSGKRERLAEHHVVYKQEVRRRKGDVSDPRDALRLCNSCHPAHHHRSRPVPLAALRDENYEFAFELMGVAAFDYLRRRYAGGDPRLHEWLRKAAAVNSGSDG